jgi:hypothetical protein
MNSIFLGIYKKKKVNTEKVVDAFSMNGFRMLIKSSTPFVELYSTSSDFFLENSSFIFLFSGNPIFEINFNNFCEEFDQKNVKGELLKISGIFSFCFINKDTSELFFANDFFGLYPIFIYEDKEAIIFCNEYNPILQWSERSKKISKKAKKEYFNYGFILERKTLFKYINNLNARTLVCFIDSKISYNHYENFIPVEKNWTEEECLDLIYNCLSKFINHFFSKNTTNKIATLTGGLDTRLILGLLDNLQKKEIKFVSFYLEPLNETNDKDVLIAQILADFFGLNLEVTKMSEKTEPLDFTYFDQIRKDSNTEVLTGLYGGELLTGLLYKNVLPRDSDEFIQNIPNGFDLFSFLSSKKSLYKLFVKEGKRKLYFDVLMNSFFTSVYNGTEGSWVHPWLNHQRYVSPFSDTTFLKAWFSMPDEMFFGNINLVFKFYQKYFPNLIDFPTNSTLSGIEKVGFKYLEAGIEPRKVKKKKFIGDLNKFNKRSLFSIVLPIFNFKKFEADENKRQRIIDFYTWYTYVKNIAKDEKKN